MCSIYCLYQRCIRPCSDKKLCAVKKEALSNLASIKYILQVICVYCPAYYEWKWIDPNWHWRNYLRSYVIWLQQSACLSSIWGLSAVNTWTSKFMATFNVPWDLVLETESISYVDVYIHAIGMCLATFTVHVFQSLIVTERKAIANTCA